MPIFWVSLWLFTTFLLWERGGWGQGWDHRPVILEFRSQRNNVSSRLGWLHNGICVKKVGGGERHTGKRNSLGSCLEKRNPKVSLYFFHINHLRMTLGRQAYSLVRVPQGEQQGSNHRQHCEMVPEDVCRGMMLFECTVIAGPRT